MSDPNLTPAVPNTDAVAASTNDAGKVVTCYYCQNPIAACSCETEKSAPPPPTATLPPLAPATSSPATEPEYAAGFSDGIAVTEVEAADKIDRLRRELEAVRAAGEVVREQLCVDLQEMSNHYAAALAAGAVTQAQLQSLAACTPRPLDKTEAEKLIRSTPSSSDFVDLEVKQLISDLEGTIGKGALECRCLGALRFLLEHFNDGDAAATKAEEEAAGAAHALKNAEELHGGAIEAKDLEIKELKKEIAALEKRAEDAEKRAQDAEDDKRAGLEVATDGVQANEDARIAAENALTEAKRLLDVMTAKVHEGEQERDDAAKRANDKIDALEAQVAQWKGNCAAIRADEAPRMAQAQQLLDDANAAAAEAQRIAKVAADEVAALKDERAKAADERRALNDKLGPIVKAWVSVVAPRLRAFEANGNDPQNVAGDLVADVDVMAALSVTP